MSTHTSLKPIGYLLSETWQLYKKHINILALVAVIPLIFAGVEMTLRPEFAVNSSSEVALFVLLAVFGLAHLVFGILSPLALIESVHAVNHGKTPELSRMYEKAFTSVLPYLFIVVIALVIFVGGSLLFIIPGIVVGLYLSLALFVYLFEDKKGMDALVTSAWYIRDFWWDILSRHIVLGILVALASLAFTIVFAPALFVLGFTHAVFGFVFQLFLYMAIVPFAIVFSYFIYKDIKEVKASSVPTKSFYEEAERIFIILIVIPCLFALAIFVWFMLPHSPYEGRMGFSYHNRYQSSSFVGTWGDPSGNVSREHMMMQQYQDPNSSTNY